MSKENSMIRIHTILGTACAIAALAHDVGAAGPAQTVARPVLTEWLDVSTNITPQPSFTSIAGTSPTDLWASGDLAGLMSLWHFDGRAWSLAGTKGGFGIEALWAGSPTDVWGVGMNPKRAVFHYDGKTWSTEALGTKSLHAIWAKSGADVWVVGDEGASFRRTGGVWQDTSFKHTEKWGVPHLYGIGGATIDSIFAVGPHGLVLQWSAHGWVDKAIVGDQTLRAVWVRAQDDAWVVGDGGTILHYNGSAFQRVESPTTNPLYAVWGVAANDVYAAGYNTVLHWNGTAWKAMSMPRTWTLKSIAGFDDKNVFIAGEGPGTSEASVLLRRKPEARTSTTLEVRP
jgi:hypothetical protein